MERVLSPNRRGLDKPPTVSIKKQGRIILNRPAASCFESKRIAKVILTWDDETHTLTIKGVKSHTAETVIRYGGNKKIPAAFGAGAALKSISYDFSQNRTFQARFVPQEAAIQVVLPPYCFRPPLKVGLVTPSESATTETHP